MSKGNDNIVAAARKQSEVLLDVASGLTGLAGKLADISIAIDQSADKGGQGFLQQQKELDHFRKEFDQFTQNNATYLRTSKKHVPAKKSHQVNPEEVSRHVPNKSRQRKASSGSTRNSKGQFVKKSAAK